jgi:hypothetical protein
MVHGGLKEKDALNYIRKYVIYHLYIKLFALHRSVIHCGKADFRVYCQHPLLTECLKTLSPLFKRKMTGGLFRQVHGKMLLCIYEKMTENKKQSEKLR